MFKYGSVVVVETKDAPRLLLNHTTLDEAFVPVLTLDGGV